MAADAGLIAWAKEALEPLGHVTHRAMMGAAVLYCDGTVFAVVDAEAIYFKADATSAPAWDAAGCPPFTFTNKQGETVSMNYRRAPDDVYDDADAMREWAALGIAAGQRAPVKRKRVR
ncbi:TfoX/Sxy family protein [Sphingomonas sp.]|uniref:TfoX/Sxy family protein n=1 Tax=Sphingomonas sp. TaxID=28214 RepID=UPI001ECBDABD|nr:TfoX/Sxy family protein [Sphingomonas sp.]MBX3595715.1 TfoX/Sxy family protein [Sphingomonas sp.]